MSRFVLSSKKWKKWYPNDLSMDEKRIKNKLFKNKKIINDSKEIVNVSFNKNFGNIHDNSVVSNNSSNSFKTKNFLINENKKEEEIEKLNVQLILKKKLSTFKKEKIKFFKNIENFLKDLKFSLESLEEMMSARLVKLILKIVKKIIGDTTFSVNEEKLTLNLKEKLNKDFMVFKKLELHIHPDNKLLVENNFKDIFSNHGWKIVGDININKGGCRIFFSNGGKIDSCITTRWEEFCQLIVFRDKY
ncbi:MAG TPA: flagellar assembly protein FliH [Buchnera sp. (in: enterobacteria)]|nr:flagellar assembly protein FliH [Buchnera sp. (in: enterobacteria)]